MTKPGVLCVDRVVPTCAITSPAAGNVSGTITVSASAADNDAVATVQFKIDGANLGSPITTPPFQVSHDTTTLVNGPHTYGVVVTDRVGNQSGASRSVTAANNPGVNMTSPGNGATVNGVITLAATVTNYGTSVSVQFYMDNNPIGGAQAIAPFSTTYDTKTLVNGNHTATVIVTDGQGNSTRVDQTITVRNNPIVAITSPGAGANVSGVINLQTSVTQYGTSATAQWKVDGANVGSPIGSPYNTTYDTRALVNGNHTFAVTVTDAQGNATTTSVTVAFHNNPVVSLSPSGNVSGTITLSTTVTQYGSSCTVQFRVNGNNVGSQQSGGNGTYTMGYDTHVLGGGGNTITVVVTDAQGNSTTVNQGINVTNSIPGAGIVTLGDMMVLDGDGSYYSGRYPPEPYDGTGGNWYWSATGQKFAAVYLPGNPDPTHYQMRVWMHGERVEGGSDGNVVYIDMQIGGSGWQSVWGNGPTWGFNIFLWNVNGGEACYAKRWCTWYGNNTCFCQGIGFYYDFVLKSGYNS
jgi:hypothetical protein